MSGRQRAIGFLAGNVVVVAAFAGGYFTHSMAQASYREMSVPRGVFLYLMVWLDEPFPACDRVTEAIKQLDESDNEDVILRLQEQSWTAMTCVD